MNIPVAPLSKSAYTPYVSAVSVVCNSTFNFTDLESVRAARTYWTGELLSKGRDVFGWTLFGSMTLGVTLSDENKSFEFCTVSTSYTVVSSLDNMGVLLFTYRHFENPHSHHPLLPLRSFGFSPTPFSPFPFPSSSTLLHLFAPLWLPPVRLS